jgi:hypothetical protein
MTPEQIYTFTKHVQSEERDRIINLLKKEFGEDYYDMGVVGRVVALIKEKY